MPNLKIFNRFHFDFWKKNANPKKISLIFKLQSTTAPIFHSKSDQKYFLFYAKLENSHPFPFWLLNKERYGVNRLLFDAVRCDLEFVCLTLPFIHHGIGSEYIKTTQEFIGIASNPFTALEFIYQREIYCLPCMQLHRSFPMLLH